MVQKIFFSFSIILIALVIVAAVQWIHALWAFVVVGSLVLLGVYNVLQIKHFLLRIYSVIKRGRFFLEELRPEIQQYFVESNIDGQPFAREFRSVVYQRAKGDRDTVPFSTERGIDRVGYEWTTHSLAPRDIPEKESRLRVGGGECSHPYECLPI